MKRHIEYAVVMLTLAIVVLAVSGTISAGDAEQMATVDLALEKHTQRTLIEGRQIFRFDTFGDEAFWGDTIKLHQAIEGTRLGGVGPGVSPGTEVVTLWYGVVVSPATLL